MNRLLAALRRFQVWLAVIGKVSFLTHRHDLQVGNGSRLWAPKRLTIDNCVYIGNRAHIEAKCSICSYCLIANWVAIVGRHDHDFSAVGFPVRLAPALQIRA